MGGLISYLWWGGKDPDKVDPESGLSPRDIYVIRSSWAKVNADAVGVGTELLVRYFAKYPDQKKFFRSFVDTPNDQLKQNRQFQAHCLSIMVSLTSIVDNLDKPDLASVIAKKLGTSHKSRKVTETQFNLLGEVIVELFKDSGFNDDTMASWGRYLTFVYKNIFSELNAP